MGNEFRSTAAANHGLLRPIVALSQQRKTWSLDLLAGVIWRGLTHLGSHLRVIKLLRLAPLAETAQAHPRFAFKYLTHDYLVRGLSTAERCSCFLHHYARLHAALPERLLRQLLLNELVLHRTMAGENQFAISLSLSRDFDKEGELSLNLHVDGEIVFLLAFTIVPGEVVDAATPEVLLLTRVQGMKGALPLIQTATRALCDLAPSAVLLAALGGVAQALEIEAIVGVSAQRQSSYREDDAGHFEKAYDEFFAELGQEKSAQGFFLLPLPLAEKPLEQIKRGHKIRTRKKRAFKQEILNACALFLGGQMMAKRD